MGKKGRGMEWKYIIAVSVAFFSLSSSLVMGSFSPLGVCAFNFTREKSEI